MSDVTTTHADYDLHQDSWDLVSDILAGEKKVKSKGETYLPNPSSVDESDKNKVYARYKERASFYNATSNTLDGLIGTAFKKAPTVEVPAQLDYVLYDIDGSGLSIDQQAQAALKHVLSQGRDGLYADYPTTAGAVSRAELSTLKLRPNLVLVDAKNITNWRYERVGGVNMLVLLVIREKHEQVDGFKVQKEDQYRVLQLIDSVYQVSIYRKDSKGWQVVEAYTPKKNDGSEWREIPFTFIGAENNDQRVDKAPLLDLAHQNIKHYQVGADWYNALHWAGQPQPYATGLTQQWVDLMEEKGFVIGSRSLLPFPENSNFGFATVSADTALQSELERIEDRMIALGARLITLGGAAKTATEANADNEKQYSVLSLAAENVSNAYTKALAWMAMFVGSTEESEYALNTDYADYKLDAQMITALVASWQSGVLPQSDLWTQFKQGGLIAEDKDNDAIAEELQNEGPDLGLDD